MLLTISTTRTPATDLGYLLHKNPAKFQTFHLSFGQARVFYSEVGPDRCTACLLLDVDAVGMVRGKNPDQNFLLSQYVNDRPHTASSFTSVAIAQVFGSALQGKCKDRPELVDELLPLEARIDVLPVRGGEKFLRAIFEPLGYEIETANQLLDEQFEDWGQSPYFSVALRKTTTLRDLLAHLYVLIPIFESRKHYFVGADETEKLLAKGEGWLAEHPLKEEIVRRYLHHQPSLCRMALSRLVTEEEPDDTDEESPANAAEETLETPLSLNAQRLNSVAEALQGTGAKRVVDLGCGEGKLLRKLLQDRQFEEILGMDVSVRSLEIATRRLKLERLSERQANRIKLIHGSLMYRDGRLAGFDAASVVEVIEHLDPPRLSAFERVVFEFAKPKAVIITTPNREYNVNWPTLPAGKFRHSDHRFEWTRQEFQTWATNIAERFGYSVKFQSIGPEHPELGSPTQMGVFEMEKQSGHEIESTSIRTRRMK